MSKSSSRGFPRPIDAALHGATDYSVGTTLMTLLPRLVGLNGTRAGRQIRAAGAGHVAYSTITDYPLGVVRVLPYKAHLALDAVGALALALTPFVTGQYRKGLRQWVPHVALSAFELTSLALSDPTGHGNDKTDVPAVRRANREDPHRKIHDAKLAVRPAAAAAR